ncbi:UbiA family prenyltransferase [Candidatus Micrarchaeota archaeon]|nr:UbiA family prenyltransferase [Candidatus Micrarchaeota archaeon]
MLKALWKLTRFEHALMLAFAVFISQVVFLGNLPVLSLLVLYSLLVPILSECAAFALNDYLDVETDRLNGHLKRPLVSGALSMQFALNLSIVCFVLSTVLAYLINFNCFLIVVLFNLLSIIYNWKLKDLPLAGNIYIGFSMAIPFLFGNLVFSNSISLLNLILCAMAFTAGLAREIIKSAQDMEGDRKARNSKTLPILIGERAAVFISILLYFVLFIPLSLAPYLLHLLPFSLGFALVGVSDLILVYMCFKLFLPSQSSYKLARNLSLVIFALGMLGLLISVLGF